MKRNSVPVAMDQMPFSILWSSPLMVFVVTESAVLLYRPWALWAIPVALVLSFPTGWIGLLYAGFALFFAYTYLYGVWNHTLH